MDSAKIDISPPGTEHPPIALSKLIVTNDFPPI